jgi:hypothetical protein
MLICQYERLLYLCREKRQAMCLAKFANSFQARQWQESKKDKVSQHHSLVQFNNKVSTGG